MFQVQGDINFGPTAIPSNKAPVGGAHLASVSRPAQLPTPTGSGGTQAVVYTEAGGVSLVGSDNRIVFSDFGAISAANSVASSALNSVRDLSGSFASTLSELLGKNSELAESKLSGGASTSQKNFIYLALAAFTLVAWLNRK